MANALGEFKFSSLGRLMEPSTYEEFTLCKILSFFGGTGLLAE
jgi:hypothetical protein